MKALFIGLGGAGQRHLRNLFQLVPDVEIAAVRNQKRAFEITPTLQADHKVDIVQKYGIKEYPSLDEAQHFNPDFAIVANPTSLHLATCQKLIDLEIPHLVEKPISADMNSLADLTHSVEKTNILLAVGYQMRYHPQAQQIKELISQEALGRIFSVQININSYMPDWHPYESYKDYYVGNKNLGGGVVLTEIHEIDLLNWFFGTPKRLWAIGGTYSSLDLDVEDTANALLEYESNQGSFPVNLHMSFTQKPPGRYILIHGENGLLHWDIQEGLKHQNTNTNEDFFFSSKEFERNRMFLDLMSDLIEAIQLGKVPITSLSNIIGGQLIALTIKKSLQTGNIEELIKLV